MKRIILIAAAMVLAVPAVAQVLTPRYTTNASSTISVTGSQKGRACQVSE